MLDKFCDSTGTFLGRVEPSPNWPELLAPQAYTPEGTKMNELSEPADIPKAISDMVILAGLNTLDVVLPSAWP